MSADCAHPAIAAAYSAASAAWAQGPDRIYGVLADALCAASPVALGDLDVLDVGAGTGAATRAAQRAGARTVLALDVALGMLTAGQSQSPETSSLRRALPVVADALDVPLRDDSVDVVLAAFSLNHLADPASALREAARVARRAVLVSAYAEDDTHPVKQAVEASAASLGWQPPDWYRWMRTESAPLLATVERTRAVAASAGLDKATVTAHHITVSELTAYDLVAWRMGMAQMAPFVASLGEHERSVLAEQAIENLNGAPPELIRSVIFLTALV